MKRIRTAALLAVLAYLLGVLAWRSQAQGELRGSRNLGHGVTVSREGKLCVVRVPRRSDVRLRAVLANERRHELLPVAEIASDALCAVNGDYHYLSGPSFARTYSPLITDGRVAWVASGSTSYDESYQSFWLDEDHVPHMGKPSPKAWLAIGTGPRLLEAGEVTERVKAEKNLQGWVAKLERTAVGYDESTVYLVTTVQEGRGGYSLRGLAEAMKALGCREALNLDGGPSTSLVVGGRIVNVPGGDDYGGEPVASALLVLSPDGSLGLR